MCKWFKFDKYLFGREVTVETDQKPLEAILKTTLFHSSEETPVNDDVLAELPAKSCLQERVRDVHRRHLKQGVTTHTKPYLTE